MKWTHILIETERGRGAAHRPRVAHQLLGQGKLGGEASSVADATGPSSHLEEGSARLELLDDHAGGREHGEAAVLELLGLHLLERLGVLGLEAEGIEVLRAKPPG